jgi:hypothetical protein
MAGSDYLTQYDLTYEIMTAICARFNRAVEDHVKSVREC